MVHFDFNPKKTALLIIDMQNDFVAPGAPIQVHRATDMVPRLKTVIEKCREKSIPVLYTQHEHSPDGSDMGMMGDFWPPMKEGKAAVANTPGADIYPPIAPKKGEPVIKKHRYTSFYGTDLEIRLRGQGVDTIIITGCITNMCCESTTRDAFFRDFKVLFISDLNQGIDIKGSSADEVQKASCASMAHGFAEVISSEELLNRLG